MPLFEYECRACKARFEHLVFDRSVRIVCKKCGSADIVQQLSTFAVGPESAKAASPSSSCESCPNGGACPMNQ